MDESGDIRQLSMLAKIDQTLFEARKIFLFGEINQKVSRDICEKLVAMSNASSDPILLIINSQGGHVEAADTIYDMIGFVSAPVRSGSSRW